MLTYKYCDLFHDLKRDHLIFHVVNSVGAWGAGFVVPLGQHFPEAQQAYLDIQEYRLGEVQFITNEDIIVIANAIAQKGCMSYDNPKPLSYKHLKRCMKIAGDFCRLNELAIQAPKFGSGLAGGNWEIIENLIKYIWKDINVTIYIKE